MVRAPVIDQVQFSEAPDVNFTGQGKSGGGVETEFLNHATVFGYKIHYISSSRVAHIVRNEQIGILPVFKRYVRIGRSDVVLNPQKYACTGPSLFRYPRYLYKMVPRAITRIAWKWITGRRYEGATDVIDLALRCGRAMEIRKLQNIPPRKG